MDRAAAALARAWYRAWRGWWWASGAALAAVLVLVLGTAGLLDGMEEQTERRVADFYTGDVRVTPGRAGAAPPGSFGFNSTAELEAAAAGLARAGGPGTHVLPRLETTYLLSRRSLVEAYLFEDERFGVALPGVASEEDAYSVGVLAGLPLREAATRDLLRPYLVAGAFPEAGNGTGPVPLLMSLRQFRAMLGEAEREALGGRAPSAGEMAALRMEVTAARVDDSGPFKDIIRAPAVVTGVYDSGIEALDRITLVAPIEEARRLLGAGPDDPEVNAFSVRTGRPGAAAEHAEGEGWTAEGPGRFTQRYLGQLVTVVRVLGLSLSSLLLVFPFFMVWVGMAQQLDRSRRELAVCRALGMEPRTVRSALLRLCLRVAALALAPAAAVLAAASWILPGLLAGSAALPFPLGFSLPAWAVAVAAANLLLASAIALAGALRRHRLGDLGQALRSL